MTFTSYTLSHTHSGGCGSGATLLLLLLLLTSTTTTQLFGSLLLLFVNRINLALINFRTGHRCT